MPATRQERNYVRNLSAVDWFEAEQIEGLANRGLPAEYDAIRRQVRFQDEKLLLSGKVPPLAFPR